MKITIRKITKLSEDFYRVTFEFKSDFNQLIIMTQNVHHFNNDTSIIDRLEIPTYYNK